MPVIKFELERIFLNKKNLIWLVLLLLITLYFSNLGIIDNRNFFKDKKAFSDFEKERIKSFVTYGQYYAFGFRLYYEPSKLLVFFRNSNIFQNIECNVDGSEVIKVYNPQKGKFIVDRGNYKDFAGVLFLLGSLFMLYFGSISFKNYHFIKYYIQKKNIVLSIVTRIILLNLFFIFILITNYLYVKIKGISLSQVETNIFLSFCIYTLIFLSFFYLTGTFFSAIFKSNKIAAILIIWIVLIFGLPEINNNSLINRIAETPNHESLNLKKLSALMGLEKDTQEKVLQILKEKKDKEEIKDIHKDEAFKFFNDVYRENKDSEEKYNKCISAVIQKHKNETTIIPTSFYKFFSGEISSMGYSGYFDFLNYISELREQFFKYYFKKRYDVEEKNVEPFVKNEENVFKAQVRLPENFKSGLGLTLLYSLFLFFASFIILSGKLKLKKEVVDPQLKPMDEESEMYFVLCENDRYKNEIFEFYQNDKNAVCIDNIVGKELDPGMPVNHTFQYLCKLKKVDESKAVENLEILGIKDIAGEKRNDETLKKIYSAVCFAVDVEKVVINDFIDRESRDFERNFLELIEHAQDGEKTVIYLSTQIYYFDSPFTGDIKVKKFKKFKIEKPSALTLR